MPTQKEAMVKKLLENDTYSPISGLAVQLEKALNGLPLAAIDQLTVIVGCKVADAMSSVGEFNAGRLKRCQSMLTDTQEKHQRAHNALLQFHELGKLPYNSDGHANAMQAAHNKAATYFHWIEHRPMAERKCDCEDKGRGNFHVEGCHLYVGPGTRSTV